jgi:hypothetical protein
MVALFEDFPPQRLYFWINLSDFRIIIHPLAPEMKVATLRGKVARNSSVPEHFLRSEVLSSSAAF